MKTTPYKTIGILGGMGPGASARLYQTIIAQAQQKYHASQDTDFPPMVIYSLPLFGFDETGIVKASLVQQQLILGVQTLANAGSDFIVIACNTVHYFYHAMQSAIRVPVVSMIESTSEYVTAKGYKIVGVISSESTNQLGLYPSSLQKKGINTIMANKDEQKIINNVILHVMSGSNGIADTQQLIEIIHHFKKQGAQCVILGCTEIPLAITQNDVAFTLINAAEIIADTALALAIPNKKDEP
jgi:aspartate racemase